MAFMENFKVQGKYWLLPFSQSIHRELCRLQGNFWLLPFPQSKIDDIHGELTGFKVISGDFHFLTAKLMTFMEDSEASR